jgi:hypothetical protein
LLEGEFLVPTVEKLCKTFDKYFHIVIQWVVPIDIHTERGMKLSVDYKKSFQVIYRKINQIEILFCPWFLRVPAVNVHQDSL